MQAGTRRSREGHLRALGAVLGAHYLEEGQYHTVVRPCPHGAWSEGVREQLMDEWLYILSARPLGPLRSETLLCRLRVSTRGSRGCLQP